MSRFTSPNPNFLTPAQIDALCKEYFGPDKPREIDYLAYLLDEYELNDWQKTAYPDFITKLKAGQGWLTEKQKLSLVKAIKECDAYNDDVKKGFLYRGWSDGTSDKTRAATSAAASTKMMQANDESIDDYDDDIPF